MGLLSDFKAHWQVVTEHLRRRQLSEIMLLQPTGDVTLPAMPGLPAMGYTPPYGIFPELEAARCLSRSMDLTSVAVPGENLHGVPKHCPAWGRLRPNTKRKKEKRVRADVLRSVALTTLQCYTSHI